MTSFATLLSFLTIQKALKLLVGNVRAQASPTRSTAASLPTERWNESKHSPVTIHLGLGIMHAHLTWSLVPLRLVPQPPTTFGLNAVFWQRNMLILYVCCIPWGPCWEIEAFWSFLNNPIRQYQSNTPQKPGINRGFTHFWNHLGGV